MERSTIFHGKTHYFDWAIFHRFLYFYQRVQPGFPGLPQIPPRRCQAPWSPMGRWWKSLRTWHPGDLGGSEVLGRIMAITLAAWWFGTMEFYDFPFSWECHTPNWRTPSFFRVEHINQMGLLPWLLEKNGKATKNHGWIVDNGDILSGNLTVCYWNWQILSLLIYPILCLPEGNYGILSSMIWDIIFTIWL